jgi:hypothetical protein
LTTTRAMRQRGFCLVELVGSMVILLGITGAALAGISWYQRVSHKQTPVVAASPNQATRVAPAGATTLTSHAVTASSRPQDVAVGSTAGFFAGEKVAVDRGAAREIVVIKPLNSATVLGVFAKNHASSIPMHALGDSATQ